MLKSCLLRLFFNLVVTKRFPIRIPNAVIEMGIDRNYRMKETTERLHARGFDVNFFASKKKNNKIKKLGTWTLNIKSNATTSCAIF